MNDRYTYDGKIISTYSDTTQPNIIVFTAYWFENAGDYHISTLMNFLKKSRMLTEEDCISLDSYYVKTVYPPIKNPYGTQPRIYYYEVTKDIFNEIQSHNWGW